VVGSLGLHLPSEPLAITGLLLSALGILAAQAFLWGYVRVSGRGAVPLAVLVGMGTLMSIVLATSGSASTSSTVSLLGRVLIPGLLLSLAVVAFWVLLALARYIRHRMRAH
jgi:hypothetical protein